MTFPFHPQLESMDCGAACLQMVAAYHGKQYSLATLRERCFVDREGVSVRGIAVAAESIGFDCAVFQMTYQSEDKTEAALMTVPLPCIVHWGKDHFVVVYKVNARWVWVADPKIGKRKLERAVFEAACLNDAGEMIAILLEKNVDFDASYTESLNRTKGFSFLIPYIRPYRKLIVQLCIGLLVGSIFQLIFPFLTQALVDTGIQNRDIDFIYLILVAQLMIFAGRTTVDVIQSWILLHVGTRINVSLISDFLKKLLALPIKYFDQKHIGDLLQRVEDHQRVEIFLTSATLKTIFSVFHILVFGLVLLIYHRGIFLIFLISSILYLVWIFLFLQKRRQIDQIRFEQLAENQHAIIEMIEGAQEIKLQGSAQRHRWEWAGIQAQLFRTSVQALSITQYQDTGAGIINQVKDIFISFVAATAVINGQMTLGMLLAVQFIVGQLSGPLYQLVAFIRLAQDAKISLERLHEVHQQENEESEKDTLIKTIPSPADIQFSNVSFQYNSLGKPVLNDINIHIPHGKTTAIVGPSGSGKTTLVKLLLGFYQPTNGNIQLGNVPFASLSKKVWRKHCGAVMQDGFLFSDTIAKNISESESGIDTHRLQLAIQTANISDFIQELPLGLETKLGSKGNNLSQGQRQRLLIARTVYKNPDFIFFDEATNALDADNERIIMQNMTHFFENKTVVVVAHRLSTVKHAHQIIVLDQGQVVEIGNHQTLIAQQGAYYQLVKNQLEL